MEKQLKILVVDDTKLNLSLITKVVASEGHIAITAQNGEEAVEKYTSEAPDLILMDVMMPVMDGHECIRRLRARPATRNLPIFAVTAKAMPADQQASLAAGASDYISKPIDEQQLVDKLKHWIARQAPAQG